MALEAPEIVAVETKIKEAPETEDVAGVITIRVKDQISGELISFRVRNSVLLFRVFEEFVKTKGCEIASYRFLFEGERIPKDATPLSLSMKDGDRIDAVAESHGGY